MALTAIKGGERKKAGRPKGAVSKKARIQEMQVVNSGMTPLEFLVSVYRNEDLPMNERIDAAKAAAPYVHKRMPVQLEAKIDVTADDLVRRIQEGKERARVIDVDPVVIEALEQQED